MGGGREAPGWRHTAAYTAGGRRPGLRSPSHSHTLTPTFSGLCPQAKALHKQTPGPISSTPFPPLMHFSIKLVFSLHLKKSQGFEINTFFKKLLLKGKKKNWIPYLPFSSHSKEEEIRARRGFTASPQSWDTAPADWSTSVHFPA